VKYLWESTPHTPSLGIGTYLFVKVGYRDSEMTFSVFESCGPAIKS